MSHQWWHTFWRQSVFCISCLIFLHLALYHHLFCFNSSWIFFLCIILRLWLPVTRPPEQLGWGWALWEVDDDTNSLYLVTMMIIMRTMMVVMVKETYLIWRQWWWWRWWWLCNEPTLYEVNQPGWPTSMQLQLTWIFSSSSASISSSLFRSIFFSYPLWLNPYDPV